MNATPRNLWPAGIVAAFVLFAAGTATLITLCVRSGGVELVTPDYYDQELKYQAQFERQQRAARLAQPASVDYDPAQRSLTLKLPEAHARQRPSGSVHLYRPSAAGMDQRLALSLDANGCQRVDATSLAAGLWRLRVQWTFDAQDYWHDQEVIITRPQS